MLPKRFRYADQPLLVQVLFTGIVVSGFVFAQLGLLSWQAYRETQMRSSLQIILDKNIELNRLSTKFYHLNDQLEQYVESQNLKYYRDFIETAESIKEFWKSKSPVFLKEFSIPKEQIDFYVSKYLKPIKFGNKKNISESRQQLKFIFNQTLTSINQALLELENQREQLNGELFHHSDGIFSILIWMNLCFLIFFSFILIKFYRSIMNPLSDLSAAMRNYQEGKLKTRLPVLNQSEIGFLAFRFNEMAERTESMVNELKKLDVLKTEFLSAVSHELRTPLTSIMGYIKLLVNGDAGPINEDQKNFLEIIEASSLRLNHLVDDLLDVDRIESGKISLHIESTDVVSVLRESIKSVTLLAERKKIILESDFSDQIRKCEADRMRLLQVFTNLLSNAIKYTEKGSVRIKVQENVDGINVEIEDTGMGMNEEEQKNLFRKFFRTPSAIETHEGGTGLGLVIVKAIVDAHGGKITIQSKKSVGTRVETFIPFIYKLKSE